MRRWLAALPLVALLGMGVLGAQNLLRDGGPGAGLSDGRAAPRIELERLDEDGMLSFHQGANGRAIVVNLFASWCAPCEVEHPLLLELARTHPDQTFGILYRDTPDKGRNFLRQLGNPFKAVGLDPDGQAGLDFGLTGVPETFVVDANGQIIRHIRGVLTQTVLEEVRELISDN